MDRLGNLLGESLGLSPTLQQNILFSLITIAVLLVIRGLIQRVALRRIEDVIFRYRMQKTVSYVTFFIGALLVGRIWFEAMGSLGTFLGLLTAGLAVALKDLIVNLFGWIFILWRRPFAVGDRIQVGRSAGDVIDIRLFQFSILEIGNWVAADQSTGRVIHIPNGKVFTEEVINYSHGLEYIWTELPVLITFESNWEEAKQVLLDLATRLAGEAPRPSSRRPSSERFIIQEGKNAPTVYTSVEASGVLLTIRTPTDPRQRRNTEQRLWEEILRSFDAHADIELAYPTQRFYDRVRETEPVQSSGPDS